MKYHLDSVLAEIKPGATRLIKRIAWFPIRIGSYYIWLERYEVLQVSIEDVYAIDIEGEPKPVIFKNSHWRDISTRICE